MSGHSAAAGRAVLPAIAHCDKATPARNAGRRGPQGNDMALDDSYTSATTATAISPQSTKLTITRKTIALRMDHFQPASLSSAAGSVGQDSRGSSMHRSLPECGQSTGARHAR